MTGHQALPTVASHILSEKLQLHDGLRRMQRQTGGGVMVQIVRPSHALRMAAIAHEGDREARAVLDLVVPVVKMVANRLGRVPASCSACEQPIPRMQFSAAVIVPFLSWPLCGLATPICWRCGILTTDAKAATILASLPAWPEMVVIESTHSAGGRA